MELKLSRPNITAIAFVVALLVTGTHSLLRGSFASPANHTVAAPVVSVPIDPGQLDQNELQQAIKGLGPFTTIAPAISNTPDTQYPAVLMLESNAATVASTKWTVPFVKTDWLQQDSQQITSTQQAGNYMLVKSDQDRDYTVRVGQPFMFEENPNQVFIFDTAGKTWQISTSRAIFLRTSLS